MRDSGDYIGYRVVILTLDAHAAGPAARVSARLADVFPGLSISIHAAAEWAESPDTLELAKEAVRHGDIVIVNLLFLEEHLQAILPTLRARRVDCDAMVGMISAPEIVSLTRMGDLDMSKPSSGAMKLLKKLRGSKSPSASSGEKQMRMLRRLPKILRFVPGKAQDLRAWFMTMLYWLGGSDDNVEQMVRFLVGRYAADSTLRGAEAAPPIDYPDVGLYHPDLPGHHITTDLGALPQPKNPVATVGLLMMRSYILASDTAHYDAVIRKLQAAGLAVRPAFAGGLDGRPAIDMYMSEDGIDALVSLTGFSLIGGPAYNDSDAAVEILSRLDVPYIAAHPIEFQTIEQWEGSGQGLGPVETTMLVALPEIDGATGPTVFGGRHMSGDRTMAPCDERVDALVARTQKRAFLRRQANADKKLAIVLFGFPPNAGAVGTAAHLSVFESLWNTLSRLKSEGYQVDLPEDVDALRAALLDGNAKKYGQPANVADRIEADWVVGNCPWLDEVEAAWGPAPGRVQADGSGVFVLGAHFGQVFVGVQPTFGYEGDPMRLLFETGFAPTHAFTAFYLWLSKTYGADAVLHFGMHGALEFMPGKQSGMSGQDWPDRLIGDLPNVYLYAANNPSEATLAKRRSNAVTVTHLTPPLCAAGLYKGLLELKESLTRWRGLSPDAPDRPELEALIAAQAEAVDLGDEAPDTLWLKLLETEEALITEGLHVVGRVPDRGQLEGYLNHLPTSDP
ncbi:MAG: cobaltochelatase subunit CobN, partial [Pseudomonadota bacterium]